jgi:predicted SprT family Zn-dependent metalloprotease
MNLLQLISVTNTFQRCAECAKLVQPAIRAHNSATHSSAYHCFRCYHILAAVQIAPFAGAQTATGKEGR